MKCKTNWSVKESQRHPHLKMSRRLLTATSSSQARYILPANAKRIWREFDVTTLLSQRYSQVSRAELNCCELFVANLWSQHSLRIRIRRKHEPGFRATPTHKRDFLHGVTADLTTLETYKDSFLSHKSEILCKDVKERYKVFKTHILCFIPSFVSLQSTIMIFFTAGDFGEISMSGTRLHPWLSEHHLWISSGLQRHLEGILCPRGGHLHWNSRMYWQHFGQQGQCKSGKD